MAEEHKASMATLESKAGDAPAAGASGADAPAASGDAPSAAAATTASKEESTKLVVTESSLDDVDDVGATGEEMTHVSFKHVDKEFHIETDRDAKEWAVKWNVNETMRLHTFRFDKRFDMLELDAFVLDFFNSPEVREHFKVAAASKEAADITGTAHSVKYEVLRTTALSMDFFDKVQEAGIVQDSGYIKKRFDEVYDGVTVSDDLREMLVNRDSENEGVFDDDEKDEFLYHVFKRLAVGGPMNQFEDEWGPYLDMTKQMYKELVMVHRTPSGSIEVGSKVVSVESVEGDVDLFPKDNEQNFCYLSVDPLKRHVTVFYGAYVPWW